VGTGFAFAVFIAAVIPAEPGTIGILLISMLVCYDRAW